MKRKTMPPRNHVAVALMKRKSGSGVHDKTEKAQRRKEEVDLQRRVIQLEEYQTFNLGVASSSLAPPTTNSNAFRECLSISGESSTLIHGSLRDAWLPAKFHMGKDTYFSCNRMCA